MALSFDNGISFSQLFTVTDQPWDPTVDAKWAQGNSNLTFIGEYFGFDASDTGSYPLWTDTQCGAEESVTEVPGALAFLRWQFELTSPIKGLFGGEHICFSTESFSPLQNEGGENHGKCQADSQGISHGDALSNH